MNKPKCVIIPTSAPLHPCGARWVWVRVRQAGSYRMLGCVCHHWWTKVIRNEEILPDKIWEINYRIWSGK